MTQIILIGLIKIRINQVNQANLRSIFIHLLVPRSSMMSATYIHFIMFKWYKQK